MDGNRRGAKREGFRTQNHALFTSCLTHAFGIIDAYERERKAKKSRLFFRQIYNLLLL